MYASHRGHTDRAGARRVLTTCCLLLLAGLGADLHAQESSPEVLLEKARYEAGIRGDLEAAIRIYRMIAEQHTERRDIAARALLGLGEVYEVLGRSEATDAYARIVSEFADQVRQVDLARARLAALGAVPTPVASGVVARQIWASAAAFSRGSLSPGAEELAFVDWGFVDDDALPKRAEIAVVDIRTRRARPVGHIPPLDTYASNPVWRDDGSALVYSMWDTTWTHMKLHVVKPDGSGRRVLAGENRHQRIFAMDWRSSTGQIAARVQDWDDVNRIALISDRDGAIRMIRSLGKHPLTSVALSPDGMTLVYAYPGDDGGPHDLHLVRSDGSSAAPLAAHPADDRFPVWTPDGGRVVFLSDRSGRPALWSVEVADGRPAGDPELVQSDVGDIAPIGVSAAGAVAYRKRVRRSFVRKAVLDLDDGRFATVPAQVTERYIGTNAMPSWSPDGTRLAYHSIRGTGANRMADLVLRDVETGEERSHALPFLPYADLATPQWSDDGRYLFMEGGGMSPRVSYRVDAESGEVAREPSLRSASGGADARRMAATERQQQGLRSLGLRLAGQNDATPYLRGDASIPPDEKVLQVRDGVRVIEPSSAEEAWEYWTEPRHVHAWSLSPDGRTLALAIASEPAPDAMSDRIVVFSLETRETREIARQELPARFEINTVAWTPDGQHVLFTVSDNHDEAFPVWMVPAQGGDARKLDLELTQYELISMDSRPQDDTVAFTSIEQWEEVWLLEGLPWQSTGR